ncbi:hypothetical protein C1N32_21625 [Vibrio diazotrophicus]|uniref:Uncharacterized protein n=1 Tax=Vibrio diazotrophicus TaxID=685 RepID=A0A2J8HPL3_VIBDI|nr:hypothetical protein [Vibrio diazotrophicus]PNI00197.1 hypothetical protein C1N32_21625 [Vibrio diazotrophicus]
MLSAIDFINKHENQVEQEVKDILQEISQHLEVLGQASGEWLIKHVPFSLAPLVEKVLKKELEKLDWACDTSSNELLGTISFNIYPNIQNVRC